MALTDKLTAIADAIRTKTGKTGELTLDQMVTEITGIQGGGGGYSIEDIAKTDGIKGDLVIDFRIPRSYAFYGLTGIGKVRFKKGFAGNYATAINNLFANSSATEVYFDSEGVPEMRLNPSMFSNCKSLKKAILKDTAVSASVFSGCSALELFDYGGYTLSQDNALQNCSNLKTIVLRGSTVVSVNAPTYWAFALNGTPFDNNPAGSGGTVYVPEALIEDYKIATNWSALYEAGTCNFVAIEGSEYE